MLDVSYYDTKHFTKLKDINIWELLKLKKEMDVNLVTILNVSGYWIYKYRVAITFCWMCNVGSCAMKFTTHLFSLYM